MYRKSIKILALAMVALFVASTLALAAGKMMSGVVASVEEETVLLQGADGKIYEVQVAKEIVADLKTGTAVEFEVAEGGEVVKMRKKKK